MDNYTSNSTALQGAIAAPGDAVFNSYLNAERADVDWLDHLSLPLSVVMLRGSDGLVTQADNREIADAVQQAVVAGRVSALGLSLFHISRKLFPYSWSRAWFDYGIKLRRESIREAAAAMRQLALDTGWHRARISREATRHQFEPKAYISSAVGGRVVQLQYLGAVSRAGAAARRGLVSPFSAKSRARFIERVEEFDKTMFCNPDGSLKRRPLFVTLTYPASWPTSPRQWKRHADSMFKRLVYRYPALGGFWRLEFQERGAPHFHLLLFNVDFIPALWLAGAWAAVVAGCRACRWDEKLQEWRRDVPFITRANCRCDFDHIKAGSEVRNVRSWQGVTAYASKALAPVPVGEMAKTRQVGSGFDAITGEIVDVGRWWGKINKSVLPVLKICAEITLRAAYEVRRSLRGWMASAFRAAHKAKGRRPSKKEREFERRQLNVHGFYKGRKGFIHDRSGAGLIAWACGDRPVGRSVPTVDEEKRLALLRLRLWQYQAARAMAERWGVVGVSPLTGGAGYVA